MALRTILVVFLVGTVVAACGGGSSTGDPQTAKEKQALEAKEEGSGQPGQKWGGWRYKGDRNDCFFVFGRQCYKTEAQACAAAKCKAPKKKCDVAGAGPATITCK